jgi:hypothetical protein
MNVEKGVGSIFGKTMVIDPTTVTTIRRIAVETLLA